MAEQPSPSPEAKPLAEYPPETWAKAAAFLESVYAPLASLRDTTDKYHSGFLAYMDRIILLAGATLTLTFSALATISGHLNQVGRKVSHVHYVVAECWLLIAVIILGLVYTRTMIFLRQKNDQHFVLSQVGLSAALKMLGINPSADMSKLGMVHGVSDTEKRELQSLSNAIRVYTVLIHLSLVAAFVCLAVFIQGNIGVILAPSVR